MEIPYIQVPEYSKINIPKIKPWLPSEGLTRAEQQEEYDKWHFTWQQLNGIFNVIDNYLKPNIIIERDKLILNWFKDYESHPLKYKNVELRELNFPGGSSICLILYPPQATCFEENIIITTILNSICRWDVLKDILEHYMGTNITPTSHLEIEQQIQSHLYDMSNRLGIDWKEWLKRKIEIEGYHVCEE
jgi:hypothetical protein